MKQDTTVTVDSPALALLRAAYVAGAAPSDREMGYGMSRALSATLHLRLRFDLTDVETFVRKLGGAQAFGEGGGEGAYRDAADLRHDSACASFEAYFGRPAFIYDGKRLAVGSSLPFAECRHVNVTSFSEHKGEPVVIGCSYTYETTWFRNERRSEKKIDKRVRITLAEVAAAEKARAGAGARERLVLATAERLDRWIDKGYYDPGTRPQIVTWTDDRLKEARRWHEKNEKALYFGDAEAVLATAPEFIRDLVREHAHKTREAAAKGEIQKALWGRNYKQGYEWEYTVTDDEIAARLRGDSIADILSKGTLVNCSECKGYGKLNCETCGMERHIKCQACDGKGRVPPVTGKPDPADYDALCKTLGLTIEGGALTGGDGAAVPPKEKPSKRRHLTEKQAHGLIASEHAGAEHAEMQSPGVVAWAETRAAAMGAAS